MSKINVPYNCNHYYQYDLQWIVEAINNLAEEYDKAIDLRTIHYADPLEWNITTQYAPNTVVIDPSNGNAYMSKTAVPTGILLTNVNYWTAIFNYNDIYEKICENFATNEKNSKYATRDYQVNDWLVYGLRLYRVTRPITIGGELVPGTNIVSVTIESAMCTYYGRDRITQVLNDTLNVSGDWTVNAGDITVAADNITLHGMQSITIDSDGDYINEIGGNTVTNITGERSISAKSHSINGNTTIMGVAHITGDTTIESNASIEGDVVIGSNLTIHEALNYGEVADVGSYRGVLFNDREGNPYHLLTVTRDTQFGSLYEIEPSGDQSGVTDRAAFQNALNTDGIIRLTKGDYYLDRALQIKSGATIIGYGSSNTMIHMIGDTPFVTPYTGISFDHLTMRGFQVLAPIQSTQWCFNLRTPHTSGAYLGARYSIFDDVWVRHFYGGIDSSYNWCSVFTKLRIDALNTAASFGDTVNDLLFLQCNFGSSSYVDLHTVTGFKSTPGDGGTQAYNIMFVNCDCETCNVGYDLTCVVGASWFGCYWEKNNIQIKLDSCPSAVVKGGNMNACGDLIARLNRTYSADIYNGCARFEDLTANFNSESDKAVIIPTDAVGKIYISNLNLKNDGAGTLFYNEKDRQTYRVCTDSRVVLHTIDGTFTTSARMFNYNNVGISDAIKITAIAFTFTQEVTTTAPTILQVKRGSSTIASVTIPAGAYTAGQKITGSATGDIVSTNEFTAMLTQGAGVNVNGLLQLGAFIGEFKSPTLSRPPIISI